MKRFIHVIREGLRVPRRRRPTKPSPTSVEQRLAAKRMRSEIKRLRKRVPSNDF
jgi:ribosome-associated protein